MIHDDSRAHTEGEDAVRLVLHFNDALNVRDVDAAMRLMTEDCIFENTYPGPDGTRYVGQRAVRGFWQDFFASSRNPRFEVEEIFSLGDRCVVRWTYHWVDASGAPGHVRGVDIFRLRGGLIAEKLSYVKG
jgi:ketosteroid isomerase-like protein